MGLTTAVYYILAAAAGATGAPSQLFQCVLGANTGSALVPITDGACSGPILQQDDTITAWTAMVQDATPGAGTFKEGDIVADRASRAYYVLGTWNVGTYVLCETSDPPAFPGMRLVFFNASQLTKVSGP